MNRTTNQPETSKNVTPSTVNTATIIELNKDSDNCDESVVIKVEVDDEECIIGSIIEDNINSSADLQEDETYEINEQHQPVSMEVLVAADKQTSRTKERRPSEVSASRKRSILPMEQMEEKDDEEDEEDEDEAEEEEGSSNPPREIENQCVLCNRIFEKRKQLTLHLNAHMPDNKCAYCHKYFEKKYVLRRHVKNHWGIKQKRTQTQTQTQVQIRSN